MSIFGAYIHARPDGRTFYIGKGTQRRAHNFSARNPYHKNVVNKYGKDNILVGFIPCSSEAVAFELECGLIKCLKRSGVEITNLTTGGEGTSGYKHTPAACAKIKALKTGMKRPESMRAKTSAAHKGKKLSAAHKAKFCAGRPKSLETRAKIGKSNIGTHFASAETRKRMSESAKGKIISAETRAKMSIASSGRMHTAEQRAAIAVRMLGHKRTKGFIHIAKDDKRKMVPPEQLETFITDGWKRGRK